MARSSVRSLLGAVLLLVPACARSGPPATSAVETQAATVTSGSPSAGRASDGGEALPGTGPAHALVIAATGCWLGGLWGDALDEQGHARTDAIRLRCEAVLAAAGEAPAADHYYPLRALDARTVDRIAARVAELARTDARDATHAAELRSLLLAVADASRETVDARTAADAVKQVFMTLPDTDERRTAKLAAAPELRHAQALRALLALGGPFADEARIIGTLHALDRMEIARGLPKHLKVYAVEDACFDVFGVHGPVLSTDAASPIPTGTWLTYLTTVAAAAGHPVPADAKDPQNREPLAWQGVLAGFADRLRGARTGTALDAVASGVVHRLDQELAATRAAFEAHARADR